MIVKDLINKLQGLPTNTDICVTSLDNDFCCFDFDVVPAKYALCGDAHEIRMRAYIKDFKKKPTND